MRRSTGCLCLQDRRQFENSGRFGQRPGLSTLVGGKRRVRFRDRLEPAIEEQLPAQAALG